MRLLLLLAVLSSACASFGPARDRWGRQDASRGEFGHDDGECLATTETKTAYRRCMRARGWRRIIW